MKGHTYLVVYEEAVYDLYVQIRVTGRCGRHSIIPDSLSRRLYHRAEMERGNILGLS